MTYKLINDITTGTLASIQIKGTNKFIPLDPSNKEKLLEISNHWQAYKLSPFKKAGIMSKGKVWTANYKAVYDGKKRTLGEILAPKVKDSWFYLD